MILKPSTVASSIIFLFTGIYTIIFFDNSFFSVQPTEIKVFLFLAVLFNAAYYYYTEIETELDIDFQKRLLQVHKAEWYVRVINQTILFSLWFLLQQDTLVLFAIALILLFLSYLIWDILAYSCFDNNVLLVLDIAGFIFTIIFIWIGYIHFSGIKESGSLDEDRKFAWGFIWGVCVLVYLAIPIIGVLFKHPPKFIVNILNKNNKSQG